MAIRSGNRLSFTLDRFLFLLRQLAQHHRRELLAGGNAPNNRSGNNGDRFTVWTKSNVPHLLLILNRWLVHSGKCFADGFRFNRLPFQRHFLGNLE